MEYQRIRDFVTKRKGIISESDYDNIIRILGKMEEKEQPQQIEESNRLKLLGNSAYEQNNLEDALRFYTEAIEAYPLNVSAYSNRALIYSKLNRDEEGIEDCLVGIKIDPNFNKLYVRLGMFYLKTDKKKANFYFKEGLERDPENKYLQDLVKSTETKEENSSMMGKLAQYLENDQVKNTIKDFLKDKSADDIKGMFNSVFPQS
ncbi:small glutamine-rich tetratricopeptide repeat-containing protein alpha [Pancytospora epiphaga]|nr:small glutamine-rich tetratricopeptide repeat-containing protein alpha [Pancytospora epiphaga]